MLDYTTFTLYHTSFQDNFGKFAVNSFAKAVDAPDGWACGAVSGAFFMPDGKSKGLFQKILCVWKAVRDIIRNGRRGRRYPDPLSTRDPGIAKRSRVNLRGTKGGSNRLSAKRTRLFRSAGNVRLKRHYQYGGEKRRVSMRFLPETQNFRQLRRTLRSPNGGRRSA